MTKTPQLMDEYRSLWSAMVVRPEWLDDRAATVRTISANQARYQAVAQALGGKIPWEWIGAIHSMESDCNFGTHLHNGDSLKARTKNDPKNRPVKGNPPFTWEFSAQDALTMRGLQKVDVWNVAEMLYQAEAYNGFGYRDYHPTVKSPYLWSGTTYYEKGKYTSDGKFNANKVSAEIGVAPILRSFFTWALPKGGAQ